MYVSMQRFLYVNTTRTILVEKTNYKHQALTNHKIKIINMDYDMIAKLTVVELKTYLRLRGLKLSGRKQELIARVFAASENDVQPIQSAPEVEQQLHTEYKEKLKMDGNIEIPDPLKTEEGWMVEDDGLRYWPRLLYPDIFNYLMFYPSELGSKDLSDYKDCKAYSYYKCGWLQPLEYHNIDIASDHCILKGNVESQKRLTILSINYG